MAATVQTFPGSAATYQDGSIREWNSFGNGDWDVANISAVDGTGAYCFLSSSTGEYSYRAVATNFGFSIPAGATIDGIEAVVTARCANGGRYVRCRDAFLVTDGSNTTGTDTANATDYTTGGYEDVTHGGATALWGATLTAANVNSANFGVSFVFERNADAGGTGGTGIYVDAVRLVVHYTDAGGGSATLEATAGSYSLTGHAPALTRALRLSVPVGSYAVTGYAPSLAQSANLDAPPGAYGFTGHAPALLRSLTLQAPSGGYAATGYAPALTRDLRLSAAVGSYSLTGYAPVFDASLRLNAPSGAYSLTGYAPTLARALVLTAPAGVYSVIGYAPTLVAGAQIVVVGTGQQAAPVGQAPTVTVSQAFAAPFGAYSLTGYAPTLLRGYTLNAPAGGYTLTGYASAVITGNALAAPLGGYTLTGHAPTFLRGFAMAAPFGAYAVTGYAPTFTAHPILSRVYRVIGNPAGPVRIIGAPVSGIYTTGGGSMSFAIDRSPKGEGVIIYTELKDYLGNVAPTPADQSVWMVIAKKVDQNPFLTFSTASGHIVLNDAAAGEFKATLSESDLSELKEGQTYFAEFWSKLNDDPPKRQDTGTILLGRSIGIAS